MERCSRHVIEGSSQHSGNKPENVKRNIINARNLELNRVGDCGEPELRFLIPRMSHNRPRNVWLSSDDLLLIFCPVAIRISEGSMTFLFRNG
jgi:hypothetical protein